MIDHLLGRPSSSWRRTQVFLVIFFWVWRLYKGDGKAAITGGRRAIGGRTAVQRSRILRYWFLLLRAVGFDAGKGNGWFGIVGVVNRKLREYCRGPQVSAERQVASRRTNCWLAP